MLRWLLLFLSTVVLSAQTQVLQVLTTTDTHGQILAEDSYTLLPAQKGWAKLATLIRAQKAKNPNTLLIDCGDSLQGEPISYVRARVRKDLPEPAVAIMNALGYHAMTVGNHDFDWGFPALREVEEQAQFPFLGANVVLSATGKPAFTPYVIVEQAGLRVAVLGLTTSQLPRLTEGGPLKGLRVEDAVLVARQLVPQLRQTEKADVVVLAYHGGLGKLPGAPGDENQALALAEIPGVDLVLSGHTHQGLTQKQGAVPILQCPAMASALGMAELHLEKEKGAWRVKRAEARLLRPEPETQMDAQVLDLTATLRTQTNKYLDTQATTLTVDLDGRFARMEDTAVMQLFHTVQRQATGAQLSAATAPSQRYFVPKGPASVRQIWALMPYDNRLVTLRITGLQLKRYLEHAARYYRFSHEAELVNKEFSASDFDTVDGVSYALDLSKPVGQRVTALKQNGKPVTPDQSFTLALSSYRFNGGGGYMEAMGWKGEAERISTQPLRNLILDYVLARPTLTLSPTQNWRTIPSLDRERVLATLN